MKECPHCGGQIRPSVIRCTHCGGSVRDDPRGPGAARAPSTAAGPRGASAASATDVGGSAVASPTTATRPAPAPTRPPADPWATPAVRANAHAAPTFEPTPVLRARAEGVRRVDLPLLLASVLAAAAGALAYTSLALPWVNAQMTTEGARSNPKLVAAMTFRGSDSFAGRVGLGIAVALGALGILWLWYALDRGVDLPVIAHPALGLVAGLVAGLVVVFAQMGYFFWDDAFITYARRAGMSSEAMRDLLDAQPSPTIAVEQLDGVLRFASAAGLAFAAGVVAWWSQRRRG